MSEATALAIREHSDIELGTLRANTPTALIESASAIATPLAELIEKRKLYSNIQGRKYVKCEGWTTMGAMLGVIPRETSNVRQEDGSYIAVVELVNVRTDAIMGRASAECGGPEEPVWSGRAPYARRSMAATRATGKAHRLSFSWIMSLAGYEPTPAEEMDFGGNSEQQEAQGPAPRAKEAASRQWPARGVPAPDAPQAQRESPAWRGKLVKYDAKPTSNGGTSHVFYGAGGEKFGTFSDTIAKGLVALDGRFVEIVGEQTKYGVKIVEYKDVNLEEVPL